MNLHALSSLARDPRLALGLAVLATAISLPALDLGFQFDDHFMRMALMRPAVDPAWERAPTDVFAFFTGDPAFNRRAMEQGALAWWASPDLKLAFFRPLSSLTHALDFRLWPDNPWLMHAHSLLWLAACVAMAARTFRALPLGPRTAALAGVLFAVDDALAMPASWIANRNALLATFFAIATVAAHDAWRRRCWAPGAWLSPLFLLLGLLAGEMAAGAFGYLLAHALFLDRGLWRQRLRALLPCALTGLTWAFVYRAGGHGAHGSILYTDPASGADFGRALFERLPLLLLGLIALPAEIHGVFTAAAGRVLWGVALATSVFAGLIAWPLLRREAVARFFALGMLLCLVPAAGTLPNNRLLTLAGLGAAGLLAQFLSGWWAGAEWVPTSAAWRRAARLAAIGAVFFHLVLAPAQRLGAAQGLQDFAALSHRVARALPSGPDRPGQWLLLVNTPSAFQSIQGMLIAGRFEGRPIPGRMLVLSSGLGATEVERLDAHTLAVEVEGGFVAPAGAVPPHGLDEPPAAHTAYLLSFLDTVFQDGTRLAPGHAVSLDGVEITVATVTPDGRPLRVLFRFGLPLEAPGLLWYAWDAGTRSVAPFAVPTTRERQRLTVSLAAAPPP